MALRMHSQSGHSTTHVLLPRVLGEIHQEGTLTVITLQGEADVSSRPVLSDVLCRLIADGSGDVVIDLAEANFIDTAVVRTVATAQHLLHRQGRKLTLRSPSRLATRLLQLFVLADLIETEEPARRRQVAEPAPPTS
jgi:anti-anti-sigma factor